MTPTTETSRRSRLPQAVELLEEDRTALVRQVAAWTAWSGLVYAGASLWDLQRTEPALVLGLAVGLGLWAADPRRLTALVAGAAAVAAILVVDPMDVPLLPAAGAIAGAAAGQALGAGLQARLQALLAGLAGTAAVALALASFDVAFEPLAGAAVGLGCAVALLPLRLHWRALPPRERQVRRTLAPAWREPVLRGRRLHTQLLAEQPGEQARQGISEVACWIYQLALSMQTLEHELSTMSVERLEQRIAQLELDAETAADTFLRDRLVATAEHYQQILARRGQVEVEGSRLRSLQEYALAYLEEARMGLLLSRTLPGDRVPDRLDDVLARLRASATEASVQRRTRRELAAYG